jgi:hypothetical protein
MALTKKLISLNFTFKLEKNKEMPVVKTKIQTIAPTNVKKLMLISENGKTKRKPTSR